MFRTLLKGACCAGVIALALSSAFAQDSNTANPAQPLPPALPDPDANSVKPFQPLAGEGITFALNYTGEAAGNVSGGLRQDAAYTGQVYLGADFDLDRIAGVKGGAIHFAVTNRHGKSLSAIALGNNTSVQEVWGTQNTHLAILTWEQTLFDGRLWFEAGRSQANIHFLNSPLYCNFQSNSACGNPTFVFKNSNFTYFPASSWMAHAKLKLTGNVSAHVGVYEVNPDRKRADDDGFSLSTRNATGVIIPWELTYAREQADTGLPGHYILSGWFDRSDYADPLSDDRGGSPS
jgi:porin